MKHSTKLALAACAAFSVVASAETPAASISLSPAIVMVHCKPGQSSTQTLTVVNHTGAAVNFNLVAEDVVVHGGSRTYSPAGQIANGIAASAVMSPTSVDVPAGGEASVKVTFTLPPVTPQRAVVVYFRGGLKPAGAGTVGLAASLGTLITFNMSKDYSVEAKAVRASLQTSAANVVLSQELLNTGTEPVMPTGVMVILNSAGKRLAKAPFGSQRLLPGEQLTFAATDPSRLAPGHYRTLSSFEFEGKVLTNEGEFTIPE